MTGAIETGTVVVVVVVVVVVDVVVVVVAGAGSGSDGVLFSVLVVGESSSAGVWGSVGSSSSIGSDVGLLMTIVVVGFGVVVVVG